MRVAIDSNVLVYADGANGASRQRAARAIVERLPPDSVILPVQALGELFQVLTRKAGWSRSSARKAVLLWSDAFDSVDTTREALLAATELAKTHKLAFWDAVILSSAAAAGCRLLLSEDMQHGFTWNGVTIVNPFREPHEPLFSALIAPAKPARRRPYTTRASAPERTKLRVL